MLTDKQKEYKKNWREKNREKYLETAREYNKKWRSNNPGYSNSYHKKRKKEDDSFKLITNLRSLININLKKQGFSKNSKTFEILGCSFEEFKTYIESKFELWMNWENQGKNTGEYNHTWQLDHIIPISSALTEEEIKKLNHYTNFQPLCSKKNREKWNK